MILQQFYLGCLAQASYLIGDEQSRTAAVVDPRRDVDEYLRFAAARGLAIEHAILTHLHADFLAGHLELRDRCGATIHLGAAAKAEYGFHPLADGESLALGRVRLETLATPGHTAESISLLVYDLEQSADRPYAVLTGDTLFVGDVGRPDLRVALGWAAAELGGLLYDSLRNKLLALPDSTLVYPAHGAGSLCGKAIGKDTWSTIGRERQANYALQPMSRAAFIDLVTADQPEAPPYFTYDAVLNSRERHTLDEGRGLDELPLGRVLELQADGAQVLDTRDPAEFAACHLAGSLNIGLDGQYATWAGTLLRRDRPIVIIATPGRERESAVRLGRIGFDDVLGCLKGGLRALDERPSLTASTDRLSPALAAELLASTRPPLAVDVRSPREREEKRIEPSVWLPLNHLSERADGLPRDRGLLVYCAGGYRSSMAASLLQRAGFAVQELAGGMAAWEAAQLPVRRGAQ